MKKLLLITALLLAIGGLNAQTATWGNPVSNLKIKQADTMFKQSISENYNWGRQFYWWGNSDTIMFIYKVSWAAKSNAPIPPADSLFVIYAGLDTIYTTAASGTLSFDDPEGTSATWSGVYVNVTDSAYLFSWYNLRRK